MQGYKYQDLALARGKSRQTIALSRHQTSCEEQKGILFLSYDDRKHNKYVDGIMDNLTLLQSKSSWISNDFALLDLCMALRKNLA